MPNLFSFLHSHSDETFEEVPFSDVDALILSSFVYLNFRHVDDGTTVAQLAKVNTNEIEYHMKEDLNLLKEIGATVRFSNLKAYSYMSILQNGIQFGAITLKDDNNVFIIFRGTDNTLEGWLEDFNMLFSSSIPSQENAALYVDIALNSNENRNVYIMGHSKGGNLALYSYLSLSDEKKKLVNTVYNLDGPGFSEWSEFGSGDWKTDEKIKTFVPTSSVVGMLLEHTDNYKVVKSKSIGIFQHDLYSWRVNDNGLVFSKDRNKLSYKRDEIMHSWLASLTANERAQFVHLIFENIEVKGYENFDLVLLNSLKDLKEFLVSFKTLDEKTQHLVLKVFKELYKAFKKKS